MQIFKKLYKKCVEGIKRKYAKMDKWLEKSQEQNVNYLKMGNLEQKNKIDETHYFLDGLNNNNTLEIREKINSGPENITKEISHSKEQGERIGRKINKSFQDGRLGNAVLASSYDHIKMTTKL